MSIGNPYEDLRRERINSILNTIIKVLVILVLIAALIALIQYITYEPPRIEGSMAPVKR